MLLYIRSSDIIEPHAFVDQHSADDALDQILRLRQEVDDRDI